MHQATVHEVVQNGATSSHSTSRTGRREFTLLVSLLPRLIACPLSLRRVYVLLNAKHGVTETDIAMLRALSEQSLASSGLKFTLQAIITKTDDLPRDSPPDVIPIMQRKIFAAAPTCLPAIITSALLKPPFGIKDVRKSIADACGLPSS